MIEEREFRKAEREAKEQEKRDKELLEYALQKRKGMPPIPTQTSYESEETPVKTKAKILVPYGLSDLDKAILEDFYD